MPPTKSAGVSPPQRRVLNDGTCIVPGMQNERIGAPSPRPATFGLMRGLAVVVMALAFIVWALASAAKVPCQCDESLTARGAAMPWLSVAVVLLVLGTLLLLRVEDASLSIIPRTVMAAGSLGITVGYLAFLGDHFGHATQLALAAGSSLIFTAGVAAIIWKGASKRLGAIFGLLVGSLVVAVTTVIMARILATP